MQHRNSSAQSQLVHTTESITKFVLGVAALAVAGTITARIASNMSSRRLQAPPTHPVPDYDAAMAKIAHIQAFEQTLKLYNGCQTTVLTHGHRVEQVIILAHGLTSCPLQFAEFGALLFEQGYNVLIPRLLYNGYADSETTDLKYLTPQELRDSSALMVDIAHGLGEHITYAGISAGGTMAAWVAQYRADVDRAIIIAPAFTIDRRLGPNSSRLVMYLLYLLPNIMTQSFRRTHGSPYGYPGFATRALATMMQLGFAVYDTALKSKPAAQSVLTITNANDRAMNNGIVRNLTHRWQKNGLRYCEMYEFAASEQLPHDIIGPQQPQQHIAFVYPILLALITRKQHVEETAPEEH
ncbi:MAG: hypothetical protein NVS2B12_31030 [Ktedonobacteraceae bacterium]